MVVFIAKKGSGGVVLIGFYGVRRRDSGSGFHCGRVGKFLCKNFSEKFWKIFLAREKILGKKSVRARLIIFF